MKHSNTNLSGFGRKAFKLFITMRTAPEIDGLVAGNKSVHS